MPLRRREPRSGEVEIEVHAAGVNLLDVMDVLGMLPFERRAPGSECAGRISAVGDGVADIAIGDEVVAGDDLYGGILNLNDNGDVFVNNVANVWTMAGIINKNNAGTSSVTGDSVNVTGFANVDASALGAAQGVSITGSGRLSAAHFTWNQCVISPPSPSANGFGSRSPKRSSPAAMRSPHPRHS